LRTIFTHATSSWGHSDRNAVKHQSPGSRSAPWLKNDQTTIQPQRGWTTVPMRCSLIPLDCRTPLGFTCVRLLFLGCAARPQALLSNPVGVNSAHLEWTGRAAVRLACEPYSPARRARGGQKRLPVRQQKTAAATHFLHSPQGVKSRKIVRKRLDYCESYKYRMHLAIVA